MAPRAGSENATRRAESRTLQLLRRGDIRFRGARRRGKAGHRVAQTIADAAREPTALLTLADERLRRDEERRLRIRKELFVRGSRRVENHVDRVARFGFVLRREFEKRGLDAGGGIDLQFLAGG